MFHVCLLNISFLSVLIMLSFRSLKTFILFIVAILRFSCANSTICVNLDLFVSIEICLCSFLLCINLNFTLFDAGFLCAHFRALHFVWQAVKFYVDVFMG